MKINSTEGWSGFMKQHRKQPKLSAIHKSCMVVMAATFAAFNPLMTSAASESGNVDYSIAITSDWDGGYCAAVTVTNKSDQALDWHFDMTIDGTINNLWNATWSQEGSTVAMSGAGWNNTLAAGQSNSSIGYCATRNSDSTSGDDSATGNDDSTDSGSGADTGTDSGSDSDTDNSYQVPENNFAKNGGVEYDLENWSVTAGTLARSTDASHNGAASALITGRTSGWNGITFDTGSLTDGNDYDVAVWVKLAPGTVSTAEIYLTAKRTDDSDSSTTKEYERVASAVASTDKWTLLHGTYTQSGTPFEHFIIESDDAEVSYYADDFSIGGEVVADDSDNSDAKSADKFVGNITTSGSVRSDFLQYWNQLTPENEGKWGSIEKSRDVYSWDGVDAAYKYAKEHGIPFKQHTFVWGSQYPNWITSLSPTEQAAEIEEWIQDFCTRYPDAEMIDVVNEATPGHAPATFAKSAFGDDWIIKSFQLARKYCPNSKLVLNDYNVLIWNTDEFIQMAKPAVEAGVVDAIGLQSHGLESLSASQLKTNLDKVAALGLPIYISEYDIAKTDDQEQLNIMKEQFPVFYKDDAVAGITLWGYIAGKTWKEGTGLINSDGTQRPAMKWLMNYLEEQRDSDSKK
ncbi:endo-1,4-beta-xylanase [Vibrio quintilis]|uniref:Beta-xylanase n=1 Tax=Vibrio quintilis TaxID=1117707 RepID=A0A1M7YUY8_9VIBR|nr:endo-1,4-beta-xylanase [Vibrio quintilis]SHO56497.1 Endo-1,4-beta-xylanase B precursor [Vibrio quintilis]